MQRGNDLQSDGSVAGRGEFQGSDLVLTTKLRRSKNFEARIQGSTPRTTFCTSVKRK